MALTDHRSKNLELRSRTLVATYMNWGKSLGLLRRDPHKLVKLMTVFSHFDFSQYEISHLKAA
jgi:hypothetical protein